MCPSARDAQLYRCPHSSIYTTIYMTGTLCHHKLREALTSADAIMSGFSDPDPTGEVLALLALLE